MGFLVRTVNPDNCVSVMEAANTFGFRSLTNHVIEEAFVNV